MTRGFIGTITGLVLAFISSASMGDNAGLKERDWKSKAVSVEDLGEWERWGRGSVETFRGQSLQLLEAKGSEGLMITSDESYGKQVAITYEVMTLRSATVLVTMQSASEPGSDTSLYLPRNYDGSMKPWIEDYAHYFFAYHNAPHGRYPFVVRSGRDQWKLLAEAKSYTVRSGRWHEVEVGRNGGRLWLRIDGKTIINARDPDPISGGHLAFRIRGTGLERASCLLRNVVVHEPADQANEE